MQGGRSQRTNNVLRRIRRRAEALGVLLKPFVQIYGYETEKGLEWNAQAKYYPNLAVNVWFAQGDDDIEEARKSCGEIIEIKEGKLTWVYGISWQGPWPDRPSVRTQ